MRSTYLHNICAEQQHDHQTNNSPFPCSVNPRAHFPMLAPFSMILCASRTPSNVSLNRCTRWHLTFPESTSSANSSKILWCDSTSTWCNDLVPRKHQTNERDLAKNCVPYIFAWPCTIEQILPNGAAIRAQTSMYSSVVWAMNMYLRPWLASREGV